MKKPTTVVGSESSAAESDHSGGIDASEVPAAEHACDLATSYPECFACENAGPGRWIPEGEWICTACIEKSDADLAGRHGPSHCVSEDGQRTAVPMSDEKRPDSTHKASEANMRNDSEGSEEREREQRQLIRGERFKAFTEALDAISDADDTDAAYRAIRELRTAAKPRSKSVPCLHGVGDDERGRCKACGVAVARMVTSEACPHGWPARSECSVCKDADRAYPWQCSGEVRPPKNRNVANEDSTAWMMAQSFTLKHVRELSDASKSSIKFRAQLAELLADARRYAVRDAAQRSEAASLATSKLDHKLGSAEVSFANSQSVVDAAYEAGRRDERCLVDWVRRGEVDVCPHCNRVREGTAGFAIEHHRECTEKRRERDQSNDEGGEAKRTRDASGDAPSDVRGPGRHDAGDDRGGTDLPTPARVDGEVTPNASPALTNEIVIAAALRLVFDEIGVACAAVEDECTNDPAHRWGARECLRRIAAIREKTIKTSAPSSAHTGPMGDGGPPDSGSDRKEGASVSPPLSFPTIGPACPRGGEIVDYCIGLCSCGECPTPRPDFELPASDGRDQRESVEVPRSLERGGNERRPSQQGVTAGETATFKVGQRVRVVDGGYWNGLVGKVWTLIPGGAWVVGIAKETLFFRNHELRDQWEEGAPIPSCGWCKGNPIGDCSICQAKPSTPETYADDPPVAGLSSGPAQAKVMIVGRLSPADVAEMGEQPVVVLVTGSTADLQRLGAMLYQHVTVYAPKGGAL